MQSNGFNEERRKLIRQAICPQGIPDYEFLLFMEQCEKSGLDPLIKEAFCVPRSVKISAKGQPDKWGTKYEFQPSETGFLARAERFPDYRGIMGAAVYEEDECLVDEGEGVVLHKYNPAKRKGKLVGAWARIRREGKDPVVRWVDLSTRIQSTPLWGKDAPGMILKCAKVAALRTAYPAAFGGLYVAGERPDDVETGEDVEAPVTVTREKPALPSPAPREVLTFSTAPEKVAAKVGERECVTVDATMGQAFNSVTLMDDPDPIEAECAAICEKAQAATSQADLDALKPRALALPEKSVERKQAGAALNEAWTRIKKAGGA